MLDWFDRHARWQARWQRWGQPVLDALEAWRARRHDAADTRAARRRERMEGTKEALIEQALARAVLDRSSEELREALLAEIWARHREELVQHALEEVRAAQQEHLAALEERLKDRAAKRLKQQEQDLDRQADVTEERRRQELEQEYGDRIATLREQRNSAMARAELAEHQLVDLLRQLLSEERRRYLYDSHIDRLDVAGLNAILARYGYAIRSAARPSERQVAVRLRSDSQLVQRAVFWLDKVPIGEVPKPDDDEGEEDEPGV